MKIQKLKCSIVKTIGRDYVTLKIKQVCIMLVCEPIEWKFSPLRVCLLLHSSNLILGSAKKVCVMCLYLNNIVFRKFIIHVSEDSAPN